MRRILLHALAVLVLAAFGIAQNASSQNGATTNGTSMAGSTATTHSSNSIPIAAVLDKSVDAKKAKVGDPVVVKTMQDINSSTGQTVFPAGTKITGHVTDVKTKEKGNPDSSITVTFDQAVAKNGQAMPIMATIQGLSAPHPNDAGTDSSMVAPGNNSGPMTSRAGNTGTMGGVAQGTGATPGGSSGIGNVNTDATNGAAAPGTASRTEISPSTQGAVGYSGMTLSSAADGSTVITEHNKNVKLDTGTQLILRLSKR